MMGKRERDREKGIGNREGKIGCNKVQGRNWYIIEASSIIAFWTEDPSNLITIFGIKGEYIVMIYSGSSSNGGGTSKIYHTISHKCSAESFSWKEHTFDLL